MGRFSDRATEVGARFGKSATVVEPEGPSFRAAPAGITSAREMALQGFLPPGVTPSQLREAGGVPRVTERLGITGAAEAAGATLGGVAGGAASGGVGPQAMAGAAAASIPGAAAGRSLANSIAALEDIATFGQADPATLQSSFASAAGAATEEAGANTVLNVLFRGTSSLFRGFGRVTGMRSPDVSEAIQGAQTSGVDVGALDTDKPFFNISSRVAAVMPLIGGPVRRARETKGLQISEQYARILDDVSPPIDAVQLGSRISDDALRIAGARRKHIQTLYADLFKFFDDIGNPRVVPTEGIRARADEMFNDIDQLPKDSQGNPIGVPISGDKGFIDALERFRRLPELATPREIRALQKNLNQASRLRSGIENQANEFRIVELLGEGVSEALQQIDASLLDQDTAEAIGAKVLAANRANAEFKALTRTAAGRNLSRADANFFRSGFSRPGSVETDEIASLYLSSTSTLRSPQFVANFEELAGKENRQALGRLVLEKAFDATEGIAKVARNQRGSLSIPGRIFRALGFKRGEFQSGATEVAVFDARAVRKRLGLSGENTRRNRQALGALLKGSEVSVDELDNFLKTAMLVQSAPVGDPSTFLTRRVILSGTPRSLVPGAGIAGAGAGAAVEAAGGLTSLGAFILGGRAFSKLISTPNGLRILREGLKPNLPRQQMLLLADRIRREAPDIDVDIPEIQEQLGINDGR